MELESISLQAEMKAALRQAIDQLYGRYVGSFKAKKFVIPWVIGSDYEVHLEVKHEKST